MLKFDEIMWFTRNVYFEEYKISIVIREFKFLNRRFVLPLQPQKLGLELWVSKA